MIANVPIYPVDSVIQPFEQLGPDRWTIFSYLILWRLVINLHGKNWVWCARNMCFWIPIYLPVEHCWFWPCRQYLKEKKINFHIKMKMCEKNFFKHVSSILSTEPSFNRAIRNFIWLKTFQVTPHFGHNQCKILSHVILFSNLVAFHKDVFKCPHKSNSSFMLHCL